MQGVRQAQLWEVSTVRLIRLTIFLLFLSAWAHIAVAQHDSAVIHTDRYSDSTQNDLAILVAFPDLQIELTNRFGISNVFGQIIDRDKDWHLRIGHAGIIIIDRSSGAACYYDFGRYEHRANEFGQRPQNHGITRCSSELEDLYLPQALFANGELLNLNDILVSLRNNASVAPYGRITAAVYHGLSYEAMIAYADTISMNGYLPYGAPFFQYCSRFAREVAEAGGARFGFFTYTGQQNVNATLRQNPGTEEIEVE
jgi:hypothetical protein